MVREEGIAPEREGHAAGGQSSQSGTALPWVSSQLVGGAWATIWTTPPSIPLMQLFPFTQSPFPELSVEGQLKRSRDSEAAGKDGLKRLGVRRGWARGVMGGYNAMEGVDRRKNWCSASSRFLSGPSMAIILPEIALTYVMVVTFLVAITVTFQPPKLIQLKSKTGELLGHGR